MVRRAIRRREVGFTLVELGVVVGVIAVMALVVFTAQGFIDNSRVGSSLQTVEAIRKASRGFALRHCGGSSFNCGGAGTLDNINRLVGADNFFTQPPEDPWGNGLVTVAAAGAANDWVDISLCLGQGDNSDELATDFEYVAQNMGTVTIGANCGVGNRGTRVTVRTR